MNSLIIFELYSGNTEQIAGVITGAINGSTVKKVIDVDLSLEHRNIQIILLSHHLARYQ